MKKILLLLIFIFKVCSYGDVGSFTIDNDALASKQDGRYTNGLFFTYFKDTNSSKSFNFLNHLQTNNAFSISHIMFTPNDKTKSHPILNDIPYAGYLKFNFLLYKSSKNYFHEFGINIGAVGPITLAEELQKEFHSLIGHTKPKGWGTQLANRLMGGISYNFAYKTDKRKWKNIYYNWTNNIRGDLGNFYSGYLVSSMFRFGTSGFDAFATTGNFIGGEESNLLHYKPSKNLKWSISFGLFANKIANYYIINRANEKGYHLSKLNYTIGEEVIYTIYYKMIEYSFKIKSTYFHGKGIFSQAKKQWGGLSVTWRF